PSWGGLASEREAGGQLALGAPPLLRRRGLRLGPSQHLLVAGDDGLGALGRDADVADEGALVLVGLVPEAAVVGEALVDELPVKPRAAGVAEHVAEDGRGVARRVGHRDAGSVVGDVDTVELG